MKKLILLVTLLAAFLSGHVAAKQTKSVRVVIDLDMIENEKSESASMQYAHVILLGNNTYYKNSEIYCKHKTNKSMTCKGTIDLPEGYYEVLLKQNSNGFHTDRRNSTYYNSANAKIRILGGTRKPQTTSLVVKGANHYGYNEVRDYNSVFDFEVKL